ncbi:DNA helicase II [Clostridium sp. C105KSO15]|nr:DNA helicase II [Clostridium sp. C105KSO15]
MIFNKFLDMYPNAKKIFLETNYRSKPRIINFASNLISHNSQRFTKKILSSKTGDSKVKIVAVENNIGQADDVIKIIENYRKQNVPLNTIAILYRVKKEARFLCNRLQVEKIPFFTKELPESLHNGMVFGDIKAYYRLANDLWGSTDLQRIINRPKRYIKFEVIRNCSLNKEEILQRCLKGIQCGDRKEQIYNTIEQLFVDLRELRGKKPVDFMKYLLVNMKYREALVEHADFIKIDSRALTDDFDELINEAAKFDTMAEWDSYAIKCKNQIIKEMEKNKEEGIYLSTFHSSKGLEWDNVIIISANDGVTPLMRKDEIENPEEERRLFYVAMTRAKEELSVLYTACEDNKAKGVLPSRYISEMKTKNKG